MSSAPVAPDLVLNRKQMAHILGVSAPMISKWVDEGAPCLAREGKGVASAFSARDFVAWWAREKGPRATVVPSRLADQELQLDLEIKREKLANLRGENVPRVVVNDFMRDLFTRLRVALDQIPTRHASRLVQLPDELTVSAALVAIVREVKVQIRSPQFWAPPAERDAEGMPAAAHPL